MYVNAQKQMFLPDIFKKLTHLVFDGTSESGSDVIYIVLEVKEPSRPNFYICNSIFFISYL